MSGNQLDLKEAGAFGENSQATAEQSDSMKHEVQILIAEIEQLSRALEGPAGKKLEEGVGNLSACFRDLLNWCVRNGMNMADAHALLGQTEDEATELYAKEASNLDGLTRSVNA
ncbi:hypothetical protein ACFYOC_09285 [Nocardiopsis alba]|uniref:Uncharacterized protein n=1 Tax=Nocardiopsis alba TaxID=53437 RepID=A0ABV5E174_9ACTN|nr:hypothetical protein [Nocardiopsis alba]